MIPLWTTNEIALATGGRATNATNISGISIDSRSIAKGELFVALTDQRDGHDFVASAFENGAAAALVSHIPDGLSVDAPLIIVDDVMDALQALGRAGRARVKGKVIAVTGSAGKTSTKDMLLSVLSKQGKAHGSEASYNNHWGVPLTLARMPANVDFAVIEIGMNHPGEISPLSKLTAPDVAIVTTVAAAHLAAFDGIEAIAREKAAIFDGLRGTGVYNADLEVSGILSKAAGNRAVGFGESDGSDVRAMSIRLHDHATVVEANTPYGPMIFKVSAPGRHFAVNALAVLAAVDAAGGDATLAATDLSVWTPPEGRGAREIVELDPADDRLVVELIDDAYNANPASLAAGLEVLAAAKPRDGIGRVAGGRRIAVLGDMLELGKDENRLHAEIADYPQAQSIDVFHCVGPLMNNLYEALPPHKRGVWAETADALCEQAGTLVDAGDVVLVKGSKSSLVSRVVDAIKKLGHARGKN